jgi:DoxX-like family
MSTGYVAVTVLWAAWVGFSAGSVFFRAKWAVQPLTDCGVPPSWWRWLGAAKATGAVGLLVGVFVPVIGVMAAIGLVLYFIGALATVVLPRVYLRSAVLLLL